MYSTTSLARFPWVGGDLPTTSATKKDSASTPAAHYKAAGESGLDRAKIKHLLKIFWPPEYKKSFFIQDFCEEEDAECLAYFAPTQNSPNTKSRIVPLRYR